MLSKHMFFRLYFYNFLCLSPLVSFICPKHINDTNTHTHIINAAHLSCHLPRQIQIRAARAVHGACGAALMMPSSTANLRSKILDFRGFDSSRILILRGGVLRSIGNCPESLGQGILVGVILVGRLGVLIRALLRPLLQVGCMFRHWLNVNLAQRVPSLFLASSFMFCLDCEVLKGMFPWRTRYP